MNLSRSMAWKGFLMMIKEWG